MKASAHELDTMGQLIGTIGSASFESAYYSVVQDCLRVRRCHVFSFSKRAFPKCVLAQASSAALSKVVQSLASDYIGGDYHSDPMLSQLKNTPTVRLWMASNQPRTVRDPYIRAKYYAGSGIAHEIAVLNEIDDVLLYAGFCRQEDEPPFTSQDVRLIRDAASVMLNAVSKHLEILSVRRTLESTGSATQKLEIVGIEAQRRHLFANVRNALLATGCGLTARESEICAYIVQGYFAQAIAVILGISVNTVATHRKRAYAKLGVSRQNELVSGCFSRIAEPLHARVTS